ncbi:MAG: CRTAC1 family protein [Planctomycetota bacterium]|nr:CRTAC1 family protein [Planctomycetota bacterium]
MNLSKRAAVVLLLLLQAFLLRARAAEEAPPPALAFEVQPAEKTGLTHALDSNQVKYPWLSPLVDIDGDGHLDALWYGHHGGGAGVWMGKGGGTFAFDESGYAARWVFAGRDPIWWDLNGDGKADGIGTEHVAGKTFLNTGDGHWKPLEGWANFGGGMIWLDADGDGRYNEVFTNKNSIVSMEPMMSAWAAQFPEKVALKLYAKIEELVPWPEKVERNPHPLAANFHNIYCVDLDGDHVNELIVTFSGPQFTWVLKRDASAPKDAGAKAWKDATASAGLPTGPGHWLFPEDLDCDGDLDLLDLNNGAWYANDGKGVFTAAPEKAWDASKRKTGAPWSGDGELELQDLDNDGRRDLIFGNDHGNECGVFLGMGKGRFTEVPGIGGSRRNRRFGDVDGDGDLDMISTAATLVLTKNQTANKGLALRFQPAAPAESFLGAKVWVYEPGKMGDASALIQYRQGFFERNSNRSNVLIPEWHIGIGSRDSCDIRVRYPSGKVVEIPGAKAGTKAVAKE